MEPGFFWAGENTQAGAPSQGGRGTMPQMVQAQFGEEPWEPIRGQGREQPNETPRAWEMQASAQKTPDHKEPQPQGAGHGGSERVGQRNADLGTR